MQTTLSRKKRPGRKKGGHRSLWLKLRSGDLEGIHHPSRLHEQVQVHLQSKLVKIDKFLLTLGAWVGTSDVCHIQLADEESLLFCLRFDGRYRLWLKPLVGQVFVNDDLVGPRGVSLDPGDEVVAGSFTFKMVPKPTAKDRRGPLARPQESIVLDSADVSDLPTSDESASTVRPLTAEELAAEESSAPAFMPDAVEEESFVAEDSASSVDQNDIEGVIGEEEETETDTVALDEEIEESDVAAEAEEDSTLVVHRESDDSDFNEFDLDDVEASDSSVYLSLATASRLRTKDTDTEIPVVDGRGDAAETSDDSIDSSSSRSAWRRPKFAVDGQEVEPFVVSVPAVSDDVTPAAFATLRDEITTKINGHAYGAVVLDFDQIQEWTPSLTPQLIELCEDVESRGGMCAATRMSVDFLPQFEHSGLRECFTLYPSKQQAIASFE